ncbi:MAG: hypothetical protein IPG10_20540 [Flavobacteriales bacterium]|nr:hypothetical protein [Flavobacteriales bacterium]
MIGTALGVELLALALAAAGYHNTWLYNGFALLEFLLFLRLVGLMEPKWQRPLLFSAAAGSCGMLLCYLHYRSLDFLLTEGIILLALISVMWSLGVLWQLAQKCEVRLASAPGFWLFLGFLVYFGGIVPFVGMMRFLFQDDAELTRMLYQIITVVAILRYIFTGAACYLARSEGAWRVDEQQ